MLVPFKLLCYRFTRHSTIEVNAEGNGKGKIVSALHEYAEIPEAVPAQIVRPEDEPALPSEPKPKPCCRNRLLTRCLLTVGLTITVALLLVFLLKTTSV